MTFLQSLKTCYDKYATFGGRASRAEFLWFQLFVIAMLLAIECAASLVLSPSTADMMACFWAVISFLPMAAVSVRRLHDVGKTGWWLIGLLVACAICQVVTVDLAILWDDIPVGDALSKMGMVCLVMSAVAAVFFYYVALQPADTYGFYE